MRLPSADQTAVVKSLKMLLQTLQTGVAPTGLGFKKIGQDKYEVRAGLRLRIMIRRDNDLFTGHSIGDHEAVGQYLKDR